MIHHCSDWSIDGGGNCGRGRRTVAWWSEHGKLKVDPRQIYPLPRHTAPPSCGSSSYTRPTNPSLFVDWYIYCLKSLACLFIPFSPYYLLYVLLLPAKIYLSMFITSSLCTYLLPANTDLSILYAIFFIHIYYRQIFSYIPSSLSYCLQSFVCFSSYQVLVHTIFSIHIQMLFI